MRFIKLTLVVSLLAVTVAGQRTKPADDAELSEITRRGKALAEYDIAAWHSTDAVFALQPKKERIRGFIGRKTGTTWTVVYGRLSEKADTYLIAYEAVQQASPKEFKVTSFDQPKEDKDYFLRAALALEAARKAFVPAENRRYNSAILPDGRDRFHVYFVPAQTQHGIFPIGGDFRFTVSGDGRVLETRQLHKAIIEFRVPDGMKPESGYHTAILDDVPEDTCVFHVLAREPKVPELVVSSKYVYQIGADGSVRYLMTTEAFKKIGKQ